MATKCKKCGTKQILMVGSVVASPDAEPYEIGELEKVDIESIEIGVNFEYCPKCKIPDDIYVN